MPRGEQPPRTYPVSPRISFIGTRSTFLLPVNRATPFRSSSPLPGTQQTKTPPLSPRKTMVLNTCPRGSPSSEATCSALRSSSLTVYSKISYLIPRLSKILAALVFFTQSISSFKTFANEFDTFARLPLNLSVPNRKKGILMRTLTGQITYRGTCFMSTTRWFILSILMLALLLTTTQSDGSPLVI